MFKGFFENYKDFDDDEKLMKMFAVEQESVKSHMTDAYSMKE